jgi:hypothetical protein
MRPKQHETRGSGDLFRARLDQIINMRLELAQLAGKIDWDFIDGEITPLYSDSGRPGIATRFVIGFFLLKPTVLWSASVGAPSAFHPSPHWSARRPPLPRAGAGAKSIRCSCSAAPVP